MKKKLKKYGKDALSLAGVGVGMSVATQAASGLGATHAATAVGRMSRGLPTVGGIYSMRMAIDSLDMLKKKSKLKRY